MVPRRQARLGTGGRLKFRAVILVASATLLALAAGGGSQGKQGPRFPVSGGSPVNSSVGVRHAGEPRLESQLTQVAQASSAHGTAAALSSAATQGLDVDHGLVRVVVDAKAGRDAASESAIVTAGGSVVA